MDTIERDIGVVLAWHDAINLGDAKAVRRLTTSDVRMAGPRGTDDGPGGHDVLIAWMERTGIRLVARAHHTDNDAIVVEEDARWAGDPEIHRVATLFRLTDGLISEIARYPTLEDALRQV